MERTTNATNATNPMSSWVRLGVVALAVPQIFTGLWAVLDPSGWYESFPGGGREWVAVDGPFNHHLVGDAGAGFLATGVVLLLAAVWFERRLVQAALIAMVAFAVPHLLYHLNHNELSGSDSALSYGGLVVAAALPVVLLVASGVSSATNRSTTKERQPA